MTTDNSIPTPTAPGATDSAAVSPVPLAPSPAPSPTPRPRGEPDKPCLRCGYIVNGLEQCPECGRWVLRDQALMAARAEWIAESRGWWWNMVIMAVIALVAWGVVLGSHAWIESWRTGRAASLDYSFMLAGTVAFIVLGLSMLIGVISLAFASPLTHELRARLWLRHAWMTNIVWLVPVMVGAIVLAARVVITAQAGTFATSFFAGLVGCVAIPAWAVVCWYIYVRWIARLQADFDRIGLATTSTRRNEIAVAVAVFAVWAVNGCYALGIAFMLINASVG